MKTKHHLNHLKRALIVGPLALPFITQAGQPPRYKLSLIDLLTGLTQWIAVLWRQGEIIEMGTLGGAQKRCFHDQ